MHGLLERAHGNIVFPSSSIKEAISALQPAFAGVVLVNGVPRSIQHPLIPSLLATN